MTQMPPPRAILTHAQVFCKLWKLWFCKLWFCKLWKKAITLIIIGKFYPKSNFFKTRKMPNVLWAGFSKGQWKGKPRKTQCPWPWLCYFKGQIYKIRPKFNFGCTSFRLQVPNKESQRCLSYTGHAYLPLSMPLPNIIKLFQTIYKLWSAQEFGLEIHSGE